MNILLRTAKLVGHQSRVLTSTIALRARAGLTSVTTNFGRFQGQQFVRYWYYRELESWFRVQFPNNGTKPRVIEFGGSNGFLPSIFIRAEYEIAPNWPHVDVQNLHQYKSASADVVVLDQVLEHVADPWRAVAEVHRVLKPGGTCICSTPFLICIHPYPQDFWRFAEDGLRQLFKHYSNVDIHGWGNRFTVKTTMKYGWLDCKATRRYLRVALWNEAAWPIVYLTRATK
jgi:SAM-dependent methyltransferase